MSCCGGTMTRSASGRTCWPTCRATRCTRRRVLSRARSSPCSSSRSRRPCSLAAYSRACRPSRWRRRRRRSKRPRCSSRRCCNSSRYPARLTRPHTPPTSSGGSLHAPLELDFRTTTKREE